MWPVLRLRSSRPLSTSHTFRVPSPDAETAHRPSEVTATAVTEFEWPRSVCNSRPLARSHTFSVWSSDAETAQCPSAVNATAFTCACVAFESAMQCGSRRMKRRLQCAEPKDLRPLVRLAS